MVKLGNNKSTEKKKKSASVALQTTSSVVKLDTPERIMGVATGS